MTCYSAEIEADFKKYVRVVGAEAALSIEDFIAKYWERTKGSAVKIPKAMDGWFAQNAEIQQAIAQWKTDQTAKLEQDLFKQKKRLAHAERFANQDDEEGAGRQAHFVGEDHLVTGKAGRPQAAGASARRSAHFSWMVGVRGTIVVHVEVTRPSQSLDREARVRCLVRSHRRTVTLLKLTA